MKGIISIIGGLITGIVFLLQWYLSPQKIKERAFKNDENARILFTARLAMAKMCKDEGSKEDAKRYLDTARDMWIKRVRKNRKTS